MRHILSALIVGMSLNAAAETWTLDSCINYAATHNINIRISEASTIQAEQSVEDAKAGYLPNANASAGQSWNLGRGLTAQNTYADRNTSSFNWSVSASVPIFDGLRTPRRIDYAKANLRRIAENYEAAKEDVGINVISAYLQVLYTQELLAVANQQVELSEYELIRRTAMVEAGKLPEIDILEAKSLLANDRLSVVQAQNNLTMAKIDLTRLLDLDTDISSFEVAPVTDTGMALVSPDEIFEKAAECNHGVLASKKGIEASEANIRLAKTGYIPT
ncbi:MAG: TolC family protein, partial [Muribaculaceae bacterium]|nr:TolC family protein [Muribaculaceae bacterium]